MPYDPYPIRCSLLMSYQRVLAHDKGLVLPTALFFLGVLALLGTTAMFMTTQDLKICQNHRASEQAFYRALAGCEEARARLGATAAHPIIDKHPDQIPWGACIGPAKKKIQGIDTSHGKYKRYDSLFADFDFTVRIRHQTDGGSHVLYWGDVDGDGIYERNSKTGENIYVITSIGYAHGAQKKNRGRSGQAP